MRMIVSVSMIMSMLAVRFIQSLQNETGNEIEYDPREVFAYLLGQRGFILGQALLQLGYFRFDVGLREPQVHAVLDRVRAGVVDAGIDQQGRRKCCEGVHHGSEDYAMDVTNEAHQRS